MELKIIGYINRTAIYSTNYNNKKMPTPNNKKLYTLVKSEADEKYKKPSAYKSGYIVKRYKALGGTYSDDGKAKNLKKWFDEEWKYIYPVYRPTKRINQTTPLLVSEISFTNLIEQIKLKQSIRGTQNLPKFIKSKKNINKNALYFK
jgi:hypothetical protein